MGRRLAILIAGENYHDKHIKPVRGSDALGFAQALELGDPLDKVQLISAGATHASISSKVRQNVNTLTGDDELFLFYAGHGFSKNGHNFITCYDIEAFQPLAQFNARMEAFIGEIKAVPLAQGVEEIFYPGELEARADARQRREGIELPDDTIAELRRLGQSSGVAWRE